MSRKSNVRILSALTAFVATTLCLAAEGLPTPPARPQVLLETSLASTPVTGKTIRVAAGGGGRETHPHPPSRPGRPAERSSAGESAARQGHAQDRRSQRQRGDQHG